MRDRFTYKNDILLNRKTKQTFNIINLYSALVKKSDFKKHVPLHNMPYLFGDRLNRLLFKFLETLPEYTKNNHLTLRRSLKYYMLQKITKQWRNYKKWTNNKTYPFVLIRLICKLASNSTNEERKYLKNCILSADKIVNSKGEGNLDISKITDIANENRAYLIGASFGDGCNLADGLRWQITDGHKNTAKLKYSYQYLIEINNLLYQEFGIRGKISKPEGNKYVLIINNKYFSRLINYLYDVPFGKKVDLKTPKLFKTKELKNAFWSGIIDTDGQIFEGSANAQLCMKSDKLMEEFHKYLTDLKIEHSYKYYRDEFYILIPVKSFKKFSEIFKIRHPCKKILLDNNLLKGTKHLIFCGKTGKTLNQFATNAKYMVKNTRKCVEISIHNGKTIKAPSINYLDSIAPRIRPGNRKIYIINRGNVESKVIANDMERTFGIKPYYNKSKNTYYFNSDILCDMFKFLYKYKKPW